MKHKLILLFCVTFILAFNHAPLVSQESAFNATHQMMALLPGEVSNVSIVDGNLYCYSSGVLLLAQRSGEQLLGFWPDTSFVKIDEDIEYVIRHPSTGDLYFTRRNQQGQSFLFCAKQGRNGKFKAKKVRLGGMSVEHPTFSSDGSIMIFSSRDNRRSYGGYDLWYSLYKNGKWSRPLNLGNRINTDYDEITPSIYRDCLLFSSNGHSDDHAYLDVCSSRLISNRISGDTVGMLQIGRSRVQRLPSPLNSPDADDFDMAIDTANNYGYWVSKRFDSDSDSQLYSFSGTLDGVLLWGRVLDKYDNALPSVRIIASLHGRPVCSAISDADGFYRLYLQSEQFYDLSFSLHGFFVTYHQVNTTKTPDDFLIAEHRHDVVLDKLVLDQRIYYSDLFGPNVDLELSDFGKSQLEPLVSFLSDNPEIQIKASLTNQIVDDAKFNEYLTAHRIQTLENYLYSVLPPTVNLKIDNACSGLVGCPTATGVSRLIIILHDPSTE